MRGERKRVGSGNGRLGRGCVVVGLDFGHGGRWWAEQRNVGRAVSINIVRRKASLVVRILSLWSRGTHSVRSFKPPSLKERFTAAEG